MGKGDLILADTGYGTVKNYIHAQERGADAIIRITPKPFCFYNKDGQNQPLVTLPEKADGQNLDRMDLLGYCRYRNKMGFLHVIAQKLPEEGAEK